MRIRMRLFLSSMAIETQRCDALPSPPLDEGGASVYGLRQKQHQEELVNLTLTTQPLNTLKYFVLAIAQCLRRATFQPSVWLMLLSAAVGIIGVLVMTLGGTRTERVQELLLYLRFGVWWLALGVASSIGLGSGLHTFVLYLGPHIALFTIKAMQCGRVDIKSALYDTIQFNSSPSWLNRDCSGYGPPVFSSKHGSRVSLGSILPQVQLEAILWGIGTALGELPPYFISKAARVSGKKLDVTKEINSSVEDIGIMVYHTSQTKQWLLSHSQYLNFLTILVLASVPNPLFDLAGILCGQLGIPFWKFFLATLTGKAIIKTHIQTVFIISVCNNQLLDLMENKLIWALSSFPRLAAVLSNLISKLHNYRDNYISASPPVTPTMKVKKWDISFASIWNTIVWLMLLNFFIKIVTAAAQSYLKEQQEKELTTL
ncbi:Vacuole membrane protein KMS1 [Melia azedarach]|uniref:Vacuole membrane protein KMS1 n=1 Tax=Melia azedarach TaxID=155640 RepID=A0ACC1Y6Y0_MELAZ|nr:Vacuole membrane protein KMS1 [Melia azedarach]